MKLTNRQARSSTQGSALLAALCFCAVLGIALASYMNVCRQTLQASSRTNFGTYSFELAETGLEEALGALNRAGNDWSDWTLNNAAATKTATKTLSGFSFGNGSTGAVTITIENYDQVTLPNPPAPKITVVGSSTSGDGATSTRTLTANAQRAAMFVNALAATFVDPNVSDPQGLPLSNRGLNFDAGGSVDSLDSHPEIPPGETPMAQATREWLTPYKAVVASGNRTILNNAQISGYVSTGTDRNGNLLFSFTGNTHVAGAETRMSVQVDQTRLTSSPYLPAFDIKPPVLDEFSYRVPDLTMPATTMTLNGSGSRDHPAVYYRTEDTGFHLIGSQKLTVRGHVVILVTGDFAIEDTAQIEVAPALATPSDLESSSLQIVVTGGVSGGKTLKIGGHGIQNSTLAKNVAIFYNGNPYSENPTISTPNAFSGVIYAPKSNLDFVVSSNLDFTGALVAKTIFISGTPIIHYDLDLRRPTSKFSSLETPFMVSSWQEVPATP